MDQKTPSAPATKPGEKAKSTLIIPTVMQSDLAFLRKALIALGLCILFSATLIGVSRVIFLKLRDTGTLLQTQREDAQNRKAQADLEKNEIRDYQPMFLQLRARGFIGEEKRLELIEQIKNIYQSRKLLPLNYEISPQQIFQLEPTMLTPELELRSSKIQLKMNMLHEMDLFNFLEDLKSKTFYTTQTCSINRFDANVKTPLAPRLSAECTLYWLSIGEPAQIDPAIAGVK